jgi:putative redox protein
MSERPPHLIAQAHATQGAVNYKVHLRAGHHELTADEPAARGGADAGPAPFELLLSGLVACTAITLRMYAERKGWKLDTVEVDARLFKRGDQSHIERTLSMVGELDAEQTARMLEISEKTPVTLAVKSGLEIRTSIRTA